MLCIVLPFKSEACSVPCWLAEVLVFSFPLKAEAGARTQVNIKIKYRAWETPDKGTTVVASPNHITDILIIEMNKDGKPVVL